MTRMIVAFVLSALLAGSAAALCLTGEDLRDCYAAPLLTQAARSGTPLPQGTATPMVLSPTPRPQ